LIEQHSTLLVTGSIYLVSAVLGQFTQSKNPNYKKNWQDHW
jgi:folylpolyglutamate synthase/dihydropteroate synthase